ncbi:MAG: cation transporter [DPANN group archaeon]|nr:cation transporter [DPANN group archaeon]
MHDHGKKMGWTIILNIIITVTEYIGGIMSGSLALTSDAGHNLTDVLALSIGYVGEKVSGVKATRKHSFGFKRVEIFTSLFNALSLWGISIYIIYEALHRFSRQEPIAIGLMLSIAVIGLLGNLFSILLLRKGKDDSLNMKAAYLHLFYDTLSSVGVIVTAVLIFFTGWYVLDLLTSIIISLMIFFSGFEIIKKATHIFMEGVPDDLDMERICHDIKQVKGVGGVHHLHVWAINSNDTFLACHICISRGHGSRRTADALILAVNSMLKRKHGITHTTLQTEQKDLCESELICDE